MNTPKHVPRFIPTLTEVVDPASLKAVVARAKPDLRTLVQQVQRELQPMFERRLQQEYEQWQRTVLAPQWDAMRLRLQQDMDEMVRQTIAHHLQQIDDADDVQT